MSVRITCINKTHSVNSDLHETITSLGWHNEATGAMGKSTRDQIYDWLKNKGGVAYVVDQFGNKAFVYPRENANGTRFVQTAADRVWTNNLLALDECQ